MSFEVSFIAVQNCSHSGLSCIKDLCTLFPVKLTGDLSEVVAGSDWSIINGDRL